MRTLALRDFDVTQNVMGGDGKAVEITGKYHVKDSILTVMFLPKLGLQGAEAVKQQVLAHKILAAGEEIRLEEEEYERVVKAVSSFSVSSINDVTMIDRILYHTPQIE